MTGRAGEPVRDRLARELHGAFAGCAREGDSYEVCPKHYEDADRILDAALTPSQPVPSGLDLDDLLREDGLKWRAAEAEGHVVTFSETGYGLMHPPSCRPDLIGCRFNAYLASRGYPEEEPGRYRMTLHKGHAEYARLAIATAPPAEAALATQPVPSELDADRLAFAMRHVIHRRPTAEGRHQGVYPGLDAEAVAAEYDRLAAEYARLAHPVEGSTER